MPVNTSQSLQPIVDVTVTISPTAASAPLFNQGLIVGNSAVIPTYGVNSRCRLYTTLAGVLADGFTSTSPEYLGAQAYYGQSPLPVYLWIGRQDTTAIQTLAPHSGNIGTGYAVGDTFSVTQVGATYGTGRVTTIGTNGTVTGATVLVQGTGYTVATGLLTTTLTGIGTGLEVDISALGESPLQAVTACRNSSQSWYVCVCLTAGTTDHEAIAPFIQSAMPPSVYFFESADLTGVAAQAVKAGNYSRTLSVTSTTQSGAYPLDTYAACAVMGEAMGLNSGLANSYFTLNFKQLTGIASEPLSASQFALLQSYNTNIVGNFANTYTWFGTGVMANGMYFDQILSIDQLAADIQTSVVNVLIAVPAIPLNNSGQTLLINAVNGACARAAARGSIAGGTWTGATVLQVTAGTPLPLGYFVQSQSYSLQSAGARALRQAMPVYCNILLTDAVHSVTIGVNVQA